MDWLNNFFRNPLDHSLVIMAAVFVLGTFVGSFLNVCLARLPLEKSILWPGSRCGTCLQSIRWYDNIPLWSYWRLQGRCRRCGAEFSARYFWVELFTGLMFAGLFWLEVVENVRGVGMAGTLRIVRPEDLKDLKWQLAVIYLSHVTFLCFLFVAAVIDYEYMEIPLRLTVPGTIIGIIAGTLMPWPWPVVPAVAVPAGPNAVFGGLGILNLENISLLPAGAQRWPFWMPPPDWLPPGSWQMGLATALIGALAGTLGIRFIRFTFSYAFGKEAMGLGDADLMMLIGAFLGWQSLAIVMLLAVFLGVGFVLVQFLRNRRSEIYFGPFLAAGAVLCLFAPLAFTLVFNPLAVVGAKKVIGWEDPYAGCQPLFFDLTLVSGLVVIGVVAVLVATLIIRMTRLIGQAT